MKKTISLAISALTLILVASLCMEPSRAIPKPKDAIKSNKQIYDSVVKLVGPKGRGSCSGEQIIAPSGLKYILTAGHCIALKDENNSITVIREDGYSAQRRIIAEDSKSDLLLLEAIPNIEALNLASKVEMRQDIRTFTHGAGMEAYETKGSLIQVKEIAFGVDPENCELGFDKYKRITVETFFGNMDMCVMQAKEVITTALIVPGSSGGAVVDAKGDLVGVVSAGDGTFGALVQLSDIKNFLIAY